MKFIHDIYRSETVIEDKILACKWIIKPVLEASIIYYCFIILIQG